MTTITREQFEAAVKAAGVRSPYAGEALQRALTEIGITIAPPEPPAAMVKLAREIALNTAPGKEGMMQAAALAALQHAAKLVRDAEGPPGRLTDVVYRDSILHQLGAE